MSCVLFLTQAFEIVPVTRNVRTIINSILFTIDGNPSSATGAYIDGTSGNAYFAGKISSNRVDANTICLSGDCKTAWPAGWSSVWSTGSSYKIYYTLWNVGIGTNIPNYTLSINGNIWVEDTLYMWGTYGLFLWGYTPSKLYQTWNILYIKWAYPWSLWTNWYDVNIDWGNPAFWYNYGNVILAQRGNVGIGINSPTQKLEVNGNIKLTTGGIISAASTNSHQIYLSNNGYVGISTSSPEANLSVAGTAKFTIDENESAFVIRDDVNWTNVMQVGNETDQSVIFDNNNFWYKVWIWTSPSAKLTVEGWIRPKTFTRRPNSSNSNYPCDDNTNYPEWTIFYNADAGVMCYCGPSNTPYTMTWGSCVLLEQNALSPL